MKKGIIKRLFTLVICISMFASNLSVVQAKEATTMEEMKSYLLGIGTPEYVLDTYESVESLKELYERVYNPEGNISCLGATLILDDGTKVDSISGINSALPDKELIISCYAETQSTQEQLITKLYVNVNYKNNRLGDNYKIMKDLVATNWDPSLFVYNPNSLSYWCENDFGNYAQGSTLTESAQGGIGWKTFRPDTNVSYYNGHAIFELLPRTSNMYFPLNSTGYTMHFTSINAEYGWSEIPFGIGFSVANGKVSIDPGILFSGKVAASQAVRYYTRD